MSDEDILVGFFRWLQQNNTAPSPQTLDQFALDQDLNFDEIRGLAGILITLFGESMERNLDLSGVDPINHISRIHSGQLKSGPWLLTAMPSLYRGLEHEFDPSYPSYNSEPSGYSCWTDNPDLAHQYAGPRGHVYQYDLPDEAMGESYIDNNGERPLYYDNETNAGIGGVKGKEYLVNENHEDYDPSKIKPIHSGQLKSGSWLLEASYPEWLDNPTPFVRDNILPPLDDEAFTAIDDYAFGGGKRPFHEIDPKTLKRLSDEPAYGDTSWRTYNSKDWKSSSQHLAYDIQSPAPGVPMQTKRGPAQPSLDPINDPMGNLSKRPYDYQTMVDNLVSHYTGANDDERKQGRLWYKAAHDLFHKFAKDNDITPERAVAYGSAFSPLTDWGDNVHHAQEFMLGYRPGDPDFNEHDWQTAHIAQEPLDAFRQQHDGRDPSESDEDLHALADLHGGRWQGNQADIKKGLPGKYDIAGNPEARQRWIENIQHKGMPAVLEDQARQAGVWDKDPDKEGPYSPAYSMRASGINTLGGNIQKAKNLYHSPEDVAQMFKVLGGPKISHFTDNILDDTPIDSEGYYQHPNGDWTQNKDLGSTIDSHHIRASSMPHGSWERKPYASKNPSTDHEYDVFNRGLLDATRHINSLETDPTKHITPKQLQAIVWLKHKNDKDYFERQRNPQTGQPITHESELGGVGRPEDWQFAQKNYKSRDKSLSMAAALEPQDFADMPPLWRKVFMSRQPAEWTDLLSAWVQHHSPDPESEPPMDIQAAIQKNWFTPAPSNKKVRKTEAPRYGPRRPIHTGQNYTGPQSRSVRENKEKYKREQAEKMMEDELTKLKPAPLTEDEMHRAEERHQKRREEGFFGIRIHTGQYKSGPWLLEASRHVADTTLDEPEGTLEEGMGKTAAMGPDCDHDRCEDIPEDVAIERLRETLKDIPGLKFDPAGMTRANEEYVRMRDDWRRHGSRPTILPKSLADYPNPHGVPWKVDAFSHLYDPDHLVAPKDAAWWKEHRPNTIHARWYVAEIADHEGLLTGVAYGPQHREDDKQDQEIQASRWFVADADVPGQDDKPKGPTPGSGAASTVIPGMGHFTDADPHATPAAEAHPGSHPTPGAWSHGMGPGVSSGGGAPGVSGLGGGGSSSYSGPYTPSGGASQWESQVEEGLRRNNLPTTLAPQVIHQIDTESRGNPNAINTWDSNAIAGHPSQGLTQTIPGTFNQYHLPGDSMSITDPQANIDAGIGYAKSTYGPTLMNSQGGGMGSGQGY